MLETTYTATDPRQAGAWALSTVMLLASHALSVRIVQSAFMKVPEQACL